MQFQWAFLLPLLVLVPLLLGAYLWSQRRRRRFALRYASVALVKPALRGNMGLRRHIPPGLFLAAAALLLVAVARPIAVVRAPSQEGTIILAMDTSGSMRADDVKPSRFEAMRSAARTFIARRDLGTQIGIVAFAGNTAVVQSPTNDKNLLNDAIDRMTMQRGTAVGDAIISSLDVIAGAQEDAPPGAPTPDPSVTPTAVPEGSFIPAIIVLLTDGQSNRGELPRNAAKLAAARGVRVYTVGLGTTAGTTLRNQFGFGGFRTELDEETLKAIADTTHAEYFNASSAADLERIYDNLGLQLTLKLQRIELTAWVTAAGAALLMLAVGLSIWWSALTA